MISLSSCSLSSVNVHISVNLTSVHLHALEKSVSIAVELPFPMWGQCQIVMICCSFYSDGASKIG